MRIKRAVCFGLAILLAVGFMSVPSWAAVGSRAELLVSAPDTDGVTEISLTVYNASFQGVQASIYFDPTELLLTDSLLRENITVGEMYDGTALLSAVQARLDTERNVFSVAVISNLEQSVPNEKMGAHYEIHADNEGVCIFSLRVPCIAEKPQIGFAVRESHALDASNPNGFELAYNGQIIETELSVVYADGTVGQTALVRPQAEAPDEAVLRANRLQNTLIMQQNNYAAVVNGALCWADAENKAVMPYAENGATMVPLRFVAETAGYTVGWEPNTQAVLLEKNGESRQIAIGTETAVLREARTFVSAAQASVLLNLAVTESDGLLIFTQTDNPWDLNGAVENSILADAVMIMSPLIRDMK